MKNIIYYLIFIICCTSCDSCSKSGRRNIEYTKNLPEKEVGSREGNTIKMIEINGVYQIPIEVNGVQMSFIFDTGASSISISFTEANFLFKQGKLQKTDIIGKQKFMDANGDISEGTVINLKEVKIGTRVLYNVEASVVNNINAPLLLGQSALDRFGKISIDYNKNEIIFE
jgi:aspartyl protease family protein